MVSLIIDHRERLLKEHFQRFPEVTFENLDLGDIQFKYQERIIFIIERKTLQDLADSIKSGRYREQRVRLLQTISPSSRILYLIEGILPHQDSIHRIPYTTFLGSYINLLIRDNLKLIQTRDSQETIQFIELLFQKLQKLTPTSHLLQLSETSPTSTSSSSNQEYLQTIKAKKKDNLDPSSCYILQLAQIPGISTNIASQIASHYSSFKKLYQCYEDSDSLALQNITYPTSTGKDIRVGPKRSQSIYNYLFFE